MSESGLRARLTIACRRGSTFVSALVFSSPQLPIEALIMEKVVEDISFDAPDKARTKVTIDAKYVRERLADIVKDEDLSRFIL